MRNAVLTFTILQDGFVFLLISDSLSRSWQSREEVLLRARAIKIEQNSWDTMIFFFPVRKAVLFPRDCDQLGRCYLQLCMPSKKSIKHCESLVSKALFYPEEASCITSVYVLPSSFLVILYILLNLNRHG